MLYHLFEYLNNAGIDFPGSGLMHYISFRSVCCAVLAIFTSMFVGKKIIAILQKKQIGETIRDLGLEGQMQKKGTPTMGGIIILISILVPVLLFGNLRNINIQLLILTTIWLGALGFIDDYIKVFKHDKNGLNGKFKIVGQVAVGLLVGIVMWASSDVTIRENIEYKNAQGQTVAAIAQTPTHGTQTTIPFFKNNNLDYANLFSWAGGKKQTLGWIFFILVCIFIVTAVSNGTNLTDGLDGLAASTGIFSFLACSVICLFFGSPDIAIISAAVAGALAGFLRYNKPKAQVFMGDTGSLAIGGLLGTVAVMGKFEIMLILIAGVFVMETLSVIIQVASFKTTGKRVFKMSPVHHHFELCNWSEKKIVTVFALCSALLSLTAVILYFMLNRGII